MKIYSERNIEIMELIKLPFKLSDKTIHDRQTLLR